MKVSFEGYGENTATFYNNDAMPVQENEPVIMGGNGEVMSASDGEIFIGVAVYAGTEYAAVQTDGFVTMPYSGKAPNVGFCTLCADGQGGVRTDDSGREYLALEVDKTAKTVGIIL